MYIFFLYITLLTQYVLFIFYYYVQCIFICVNLFFIRLFIKKLLDILQLPIPNQLPIKYLFQINRNNINFINISHTNY